MRKMKVSIYKRSCDLVVFFLTFLVLIINTYRHLLRHLKKGLYYDDTDLLTRNHHH